MKVKCFISSIVFLLFFCVSGCAESLYVDTLNGFQLNCPDNWRVVDLSSSTNLIKAEFNKDKKSGAQLRIENNVRTSLELFMQRYITQFKKDMEGHWQGRMRILDQRALQTGSEFGYSISYSFVRADGMNLFFKHYLWKKGERVYFIQAGTPEEQRETVEPLLDQMAESFSFL